MAANAFSRRLRDCGTLHGTSNVQMSDSCFSWHGCALSNEKDSPSLCRSHSAFPVPLTRTRQLSPSGRTHTSNAIIALLPERIARIRAEVFNHFFFTCRPSPTWRPTAQQRPVFRPCHSHRLRPTTGRVNSSPTAVGLLRPNYFVFAEDSCSSYRSRTER